MPCRFFIFCLCLFFCLPLCGRAQPNVTPYARMTVELQAEAAHCPLLRLTSLGKAASGQKDLWLVRVADPAQNPAQTIRLLVLCRQHGDEPASTEAALGLLRRLATGGDPALRQSLSHVTLYFVPMVNPDGADVNARSNALGADLNRDWGVFHQPETRAVARAARLLRPNLVIDAHNWDGNDEYNADCLEVPREMATPQGKTAHAIQQDAVRLLALSGYALHPTAWGADSDPHLAHRWFSQQNILSALVETHSGEPTDRADFQRRQGMYVALIHGLARRYAGSYALEKPRLESWEGDHSAEIREADLFSPAASKPPLVAAHRPASRLWLWAICLYGLALWGGRKTQETTRGRGKRRRGEIYHALFPLPKRGKGWLPPARYSFTRKRLGTETRVRSGQRRAVSSPPR